MPGKLAIHISKIEGTPEIQLIRVEGFLDAATYRELSTRAAPLVNRPKPYFIFDLSALEYLGSAGVASLMDIAYSSQDKEGEVALAGPSPKVRDVLTTLGLADILTILPSVNEAVEALRSGKASPGVESRSIVSVTVNPFGTRAVEFVTSAAQPPTSSPEARVGAGVSSEPEAKGDLLPPPAAASETQVAAPISGPAGSEVGEQAAAEHPAEAAATPGPAGLEVGEPTATEASAPIVAPPVPATSGADHALIRELAKAQLELVERIGSYLDENRKGMAAVTSAVDKLNTLLARLGAQVE